jgi:hypothetical protein
VLQRIAAQPAWAAQRHRVRLVAAGEFDGIKSVREGYWRRGCGSTSIDTAR